MSKIQTQSRQATTESRGGVFVASFSRLCCGNLTRPESASSSPYKSGKLPKAARSRATTPAMQQAILLTRPEKKVDTPRHPLTPSAASQTRYSVRSHRRCASASATRRAGAGWIGVARAISAAARPGALLRSGGQGSRAAGPRVAFAGGR